MRSRRPWLATAAALAIVGVACTSTSSTPVSTSPTTGPSTSPTASSTASPSPSPTAGEPKVALQPVAKLSSPLAMAVRTGDPALYVATQSGTIRKIVDGRLDPTPVLDIGSKISFGGERGLLGLAFSPDGSFLYVDYTDTNGDTNVVEYAVVAGGTVDASSARRVLFQKQPFSNHNGGNLVFGPDGDLYVGLGDGGSGGDPFGNGQNLQTFLGKILRIDPRPSGGHPSSIPPGNPFVGHDDALPEIWDLGLRNPWRFSFDRETGDLWIGDVGQNAWEEIDHEPRGRGGRDYGWNLREGTHPYLGDATIPPGLVDPIYQYPHQGSVCAVTGGYVYRGAAIPALVGTYVFADFCAGELFGIPVADVGTGLVPQREVIDLGLHVLSISSFGEDQAGELYTISLGGQVSKLVPAS